jgi:hypothetical protein
MASQQKLLVVEIIKAFEIPRFDGVSYNLRSLSVAQFGRIRKV